MSINSTRSTLAITENPITFLGTELATSLSFLFKLVFFFGLYSGCATEEKHFINRLVILILNPNFFKQSMLEAIEIVLK